MTDDLHQAYSDNESCITTLCEDQAAAHARTEFTIGAWHGASVIGGLIVAFGMFWSPYVAWAFVLFIIPAMEIHRAKVRRDEKVKGISIQLERRFAMRAYLKAQMRGF